MEDANNQDNPIENEGNNVDDNIDIEEDGSDDEGDGYYLLDENHLQKLKENDRSMTGLDIELNCNGGECFFGSIDWKEYGGCISNNTHLKKLLINSVGTCLDRPYGKNYILGEQGHNLPTRQQLHDFFSCIYRNSSITSISFYSINIRDKFGGGLIDGLQGHPSLERLEFSHSGGPVASKVKQVKLGTIVCRAIGKVLNHPESKLEYLHLSVCHLDDDRLGILCDVLLGNSTLKKLCLKGNDKITSVGWGALSTVIRHPNCKLVDLDLSNTGITDEGSSILGSALSGLSSLKVLNLGWRQLISSTLNYRAWQTLFNQLSQTTIEYLNLESNQIHDSSLHTLANIGTLKSLSLKGISSSTPTGWSSFFHSLQRRGTQLVKLDISQNRIGDVGMAILGSLLSNMSTLKTLKMSNMLNVELVSGYSISSQGWQTLFNLSQNSSMGLVKLHLDSNEIGYEVFQSLIRMVSNMSSLKCLSLGGNSSMTPRSWQALTRYLRSPNFALEELHLNDNRLNDDAVIAFTSALAHNKTLKRLNLEGCTMDEDDDSDDEEDNNELITERGWEAVSTLLCNKSSISDALNSNHTLCSVSNEYDVDDMNLPEDLISYLELNENKDKAEVARQKILQTHFSTEYDTASNIQELLDMDLEMMPSAIEWIGRPTHADWSGTHVSGLSTMYNLSRKLPDLFDSNAQKKPSVGKRKRDR